MSIHVVFERRMSGGMHQILLLTNRSHRWRVPSSRWKYVLKEERTVDPTNAGYTYCNLDSWKMVLLRASYDLSFRLPRWWMHIFQCTQKNVIDFFLTITILHHRNMHLLRPCAAGAVKIIINGLNLTRRIFTHIFCIVKSGLWNCCCQHNFIVRRFDLRHSQNTSEIILNQ